MARNQVFKVGAFLSLPVPTGTLSGAPVRIGGLNGVAQTNEASLDIPAGSGPYVEAPSGNKPGWASIALEGVFRIPVSTTTALAVGAPVYIISATGVLTTTDNSAANPLFGHAVSVKGTTANSPVNVRITN